MWPVPNFLKAKGWKIFIALSFLFFNEEVFLLFQCYYYLLPLSKISHHIISEWQPEHSDQQQATFTSPEFSAFKLQHTRSFFCVKIVSWSRNLRSLKVMLFAQYSYRIQHCFTDFLKPYHTVRFLNDYLKSNRSIHHFVVVGAYLT